MGEFRCGGKLYFHHYLVMPKSPPPPPIHEVSGSGCSTLGHVVAMFIQAKAKSSRTNHIKVGPFKVAALDSWRRRGGASLAGVNYAPLPHLRWKTLVKEGKWIFKTSSEGKERPKSRRAARWWEGRKYRQNITFHGCWCVRFRDFLAKSLVTEC